MFFSDKLKLSKKDKKVTVTNGYWEVIHDLTKGGCISSIKIFNGSNKNILVSPVRSYFSRYSERDWEYPDFRDDLDKNAKVKILKNSPERIELQTIAELIDKKSGPLGINLETVYEYHFSYIKVHRIFRCKKSPEGINMVGIGCIETIPELDYWCARNSSRSAINESARVYTSVEGFSIAKWGRIENSNYPSYVEWHPSHYLCVFNRGVEGIETFPDSNLKEWEKQLVPEGDRCARFGIYRKFNPRRTVIICEPHFGLWVNALKLKGQYNFTSYIGIPNIRKNGVNKKIMWINNVVRWRESKEWATEDEIKELAENGVQLIIHHHDNPNGRGKWPNGSFFWPNGKYPPYEEKAMENLKKVIGLVHKYGMKIIPYFNPGKIHSLSEAYKDNIDNWARTVDKRKKTFNNFDGLADVHVCVQSGWLDFLKSYVKKVIKNLGFDGAYYDGIMSSYCDNLKHADWEHTTIDGMIDLVEYTRKLVGPDGVIVVHHTSAPCIVVENLIDISVIMEDVNGFPSWQRGAPDLDSFTPYCDFVNLAQKAICSYTATPYGCSREEIKKVVVRGLVKGLSFKGLSFDAERDYTYWKKMSRYLKGRDLSKYRFEDYSKGFVVTDNTNIKGAVYRSRKEMIVILGNTESSKKQKYTWKINFDKCKWGKNKMRITFNGKEIPLSQITSKGISDSVEGYGYNIYQLQLS